VLLGCEKKVYWMVKKVSGYVNSFLYNKRTNDADGQTNGHVPHDGI